MRLKATRYKDWVKRTTKGERFIEIKLHMQEARLEIGSMITNKHSQKIGIVSESCIDERGRITIMVNCEKDGGMRKIRSCPMFWARVL